MWTCERATTLEVLIVHRRRVGDWCFPKGRLQRRERPLVGALREVREETGLWCVPNAALPVVEYRDRRGRERWAAYWAMRSVGGRFRPTSEIDDAAWVALDEARDRLTHQREVDLLDHLRVAVFAAA